MRHSRVPSAASRTEHNEGSLPGRPTFPGAKTGSAECGEREDRFKAGLALEAPLRASERGVGFPTISLGARFSQGARCKSRGSLPPTSENAYSQDNQKPPAFSLMLYSSRSRSTAALP